MSLSKIRRKKDDFIEKVGANTQDKWAAIVTGTNFKAHPEGRVGIPFGKNQADRLKMGNTGLFDTQLA